MKVLVTGASGLLGANVVESLLSHGHEVNILIRKTSNTLGLSGLNPNVYFGDILDLESIISAAGHCNWIVHCAANTKQWKTSKKEHDLINLEGTKNVIDAAGIAGAEKLAFVSTANTFPLLNNPKLILDSHYVNSKRQAENYVISQKKVPAVVLNPSFMIGARDMKPSSGQAVLHYMRHNPVFAPAGGKSFIHVDDVAEAVLKSLESPQQGTRFLLANDNRSYQSFFELVGEVTGQKKKIILIPPLVSQIAGNLGSFYGSITGSTPKLNRGNARVINTDLFYEGEDAYRQLNIQKRPLAEAIVETVDWFRKYGYC